GVVGTTIGFVRAQRQRAEAEAANSNSRAVVEFLTEDVLGAANPLVTHGNDLTVKQALDNAANQVAEKLKGRPLVEAAVRDALAKTYEALGRADLALPHERAALERRRLLLGDIDRQTLSSINDMAYLLQEVGQRDQAEPLYQEALENRRRVFGED